MAESPAHVMRFCDAARARVLARPARLPAEPVLARPEYRYPATGSARPQPASGSVWVAELRQVSGSVLLLLEQQAVRSRAAQVGRACRQRPVPPGSSPVDCRRVG